MRYAALRGWLILLPCGLAGAFAGALLSLVACAAGPDRIVGDQIIGQMSRHRVHVGDTMVGIARAYGVGFVELRAANPGQDAWLLPERRNLVVPTAHIVPSGLKTGITINLGDFRLYYMSSQGVIHSWPIGIGRAGYETPVGSLSVTEKRRQPVWRPTKRQRRENPALPAEVPPGPDNPLGSHALRVGWSGYAIHGTNKSAGVGRRVSGGCIRMYPEHIAELFDLVGVNDRVVITDQAVKFGWHNNALYVEAHPEGERADQVEQTGVFTPYEPQDVRELARKVAGPQTKRIDWRIVDAALRERRGVPVRVTRQASAPGLR